MDSVMSAPFSCDTRVFPQRERKAAIMVKWKEEMVDMGLFFFFFLLVFYFSSPLFL